MKKVSSFLLRRAVARAAMTLPLATNVAEVEHTHNRNTYILKVLRAHPDTRLRVRNLCAESTSPGQHQLAIILTIFNTLTPAEQATFIDDFTRRSVVATAGRRYVGVWSAYPFPQNPYPRQEP